MTGSVSRNLSEMCSALNLLRFPATWDQDRATFLACSIFLARASELAYQSSADFIAEELDVPMVTTFDVSNTQGFWFVHDGIALLAFRGSANRQHWLDNFKIRPPESANHDWGMAHPGFLASVTKIIEPVLKIFGDAAQGQPHCWLTGHSLGGALAVLSASWFKLEISLDLHLHTYGQPMPGFENFTQRFDAELPSRLTRFINQRDIVTRVPGAGYRHCGISKTITSSGTLQKFGTSSSLSLAETDASPASESEFNDFVADLEIADDRAFAAAQLQGMIGSRIPWFADHGITRYILELQAIQRTLNV